jgi:spore maturation protein CgeB
VRIACFYHSLISDWNHGNAHFLRGVVRELQRRGHDVTVWEPRSAWSRGQLLADRGDAAISEFRAAFPTMRSSLYDLETIEPAAVVDGADLVLVHEWSDPWLVAELGRARAQADFVLLFHDTHHRSVTAPEEMERYDLSGYDGVLAYGEAIRRLYLDRSWTERAWTWHEAADVELFRPLLNRRREGDLVWIGNWGDGERAAELETFLIAPARRLRLDGSVYGVRYPPQALRRLKRAGLVYRGWAPNHRVPELFASHRATVHVPRRPYSESLPGIPTIRLFEALACGIPLVCSPWDDAEHLFEPGRDYLVAHDKRQMCSHLREILADEDLAAGLAAQGRRTILARHTCGHRVDELLAIVDGLRLAERAA